MAAEGSAEKTLHRTRLSIYFDTELNRFRFSSSPVPLYETFYAIPMLRENQQGLSPFVSGTAFAEYRITT